MNNLTRPSVAALIVANMVPVAGVLFLDWTFQSVLYLYLFETVIIGFYSVLHMLQARLPEVSYENQSLKTRTGRVVLQRSLYVAAFCIIFGIVVLFNATFIGIMFPLYDADFKILLPGIISLFLSHGVSYYLNFLGNEEYRKMSAREIFIKPFKRVMFPQLLFILAALPFLYIFGEGGPIVVFVLCKILADAKTHMWEHGSFWLTPIQRPGSGM